MGFRSLFQTNLLDHCTSSRHHVSGGGEGMHIVVDGRGVCGEGGHACSGGWEGCVCVWREGMHVVRGV